MAEILKCPHCGGDLNDLSVRLEAIKLVSEMNSRLASLTPTDQLKVMDEALDTTTRELIQAWEEIRRLKNQ